jgi:hypothetical protein
MVAMFKASLRVINAVPSLIVLSFYFFIYISPSNAEYQKSCKVSYVNTGKIYNVVCHFLSGSELNKKTASFDYDTFNTYSVIFWGDNRATVIKIDSTVFCSTEPNFDCANSILPLEGSDKEGRQWKICNQSDYFCD